jgi:hypothetical protein
VPVSSSDIRNVMEEPDDPYREESVLVSSACGLQAGLAATTVLVPAAAASICQALQAQAVCRRLFMDVRSALSGCLRCQLGAGA